MEVKRGQDFNNPGSQDQDPIFSNYRLPKHEVCLLRLLLHSLLGSPCTDIQAKAKLCPQQDNHLNAPRCRSATRAASLRRSSPATWRS